MKKNLPRLAEIIIIIGLIAVIFLDFLRDGWLVFLVYAVLAIAGMTYIALLVIRREGDE